MKPINAISSLGDGELSALVADADPSLLLAAIVSITGRTDRIGEFAPHISNVVVDLQLVAHMPEDVRAELNSWALEVIADPDTCHDRDPLSLDDVSFRQLAEPLVGRSQADVSLPFLREQGGFVPIIQPVDASGAASGHFKVVIIGAGMAGVAMSIAAKHAGFDFEVLERNAGVGGVWWQNRYPGVGVDTHSKYYSLSFEINSEWTNSHPEGGEFRDYLERLVDKHALVDHTIFGAEVTELVWDNVNARWRIVYVKGDTRFETSANVVVSAAGYFDRPALPDVPGIETFEGEWFHAAEWNHNYDFAGKRVAVIGTGCSAVQIVDALGPMIGALSLFQRQPHWVVPSTGCATIASAERWLLTNVPSYAQWARLQTYLRIGDANYGSVRYDGDWAAQHDLSISAANEQGLRVALGHLGQSFADRPDLLEKLKPNFAFMGKRPVRDPGAYYETLRKVTTDVVTGGLAQVTAKGPADSEGNLHEVDVIVYATGFSSNFLSGWTVVGRDGVKLSDVWAESPSAYLSCQVPGFPNFFLTSGPNANPSHGGGHNFQVEAVVHYVIECLRMLVDRGARSLEPTEDALQRWTRQIRQTLADSVWVRETRATTYYRDLRGNVVLANPLRMEDHWTRLREPVVEDLIVR